MEVWPHGDELYEVNSMYSLPDDAWQHELTGLTGAPGTGPYLAIVIPDATPDDSPSRRSPPITSSSASATAGCRGRS